MKEGPAFPGTHPDLLLCLLFISVHYFNKRYFLCLQNNSSQWILTLFTSSIWKGISCSKAPFSWDLSVDLETPSFEDVRWTIEDQGCQIQVYFCQKNPENVIIWWSYIPSGPCLGLNLIQDNKALPDSLSMKDQTREGWASKLVKWNNSTLNGLQRLHNGWRRLTRKTWTLSSQITHGNVEERILCHSGRKKDMTMAWNILIFDSVKSESLLSDKFS